MGALLAISTACMCMREWEQAWGADVHLCVVLRHSLLLFEPLSWHPRLRCLMRALQKCSVPLIVHLALHSTTHTIPRDPPAYREGHLAKLAHDAV